jgi:NAD(P)-dependent dehydrogenase (short-subunit alcohol dehydrogenase family)
VIDVDTTYPISGAIGVVTGASSGLGRRIALDLAANGAVVTGIARREEPLRALAAKMQRLTPASGYVVCDVSDTDRFAGVLADIETRHGRIDLLINDAGIGEPAEDGIAKYRTVMETNFFAKAALSAFTRACPTRSTSAASTCTSSTPGSSPRR